MNVRTTLDLPCRWSYDDGDTWTDTTLPAGSLLSDVVLEPPDRGVGIMDGTAVGTVMGPGGVPALVDVGGTPWDWWGEPATEPGEQPVPGWFRVDDVDPVTGGRRDPGLVRLEQAVRAVQPVGRVAHRWQRGWAVTYTTAMGTMVVRSCWTRRGAVRASARLLARSVHYQGPGSYHVGHYDVADRRPLR